MTCSLKKAMAKITQDSENGLLNIHKFYLLTELSKVAIQV